MPPLQLKGDLEEMEVKGSYRIGASPSTGLKTFQGHSFAWVCLLLYRYAFGVFYSPNRLACDTLVSTDRIKDVDSFF